MTIRKTLLRAFLMIGLVPAILLAALAFVKARAAMQEEIERNLTSQAQAVAADINKILFERLQNGATWSTLEVMQDLQVQDVDKRLSNFLAKLQSGYGGVYSRLAVLDRQRLVVASSAPHMLGQHIGQQQPWKHVTMAGAELTLERPRPGDGDTALTIAVPLTTQFSPDVWGELRLSFDWAQIDHLLDGAAGTHSMVLVDEDGTVLAASRTLRQSGMSLPGIESWHVRQRPDGAFLHDGSPLLKQQVLVGLGRAPGYGGFAGIGLSALVIEPQREALAPVQHMAEISLAILATLALLTILIARSVSGTIAQPLASLTAYTRRYKLGQDPHLVPPPAHGEVGELGEAFHQMMQEIDEARLGLVHASKLAMIGEMASVIIHEVRTPLGILRSSAQILRREAGLSIQGLELLGFIESETERLNRLVSTILDSARPRPLRLTTVDMHVLVRQTVQMLAAQLDQRQILIEKKLDATDVWVLCDSEQITQVLLNLIHNALQVLPNGGTVQITSYQSDERFMIEIADDGPGIPAMERSRVFEAFFFQREGGVGLGLAIVQQIVQAHGGEVTVDASEFGGARFIVALPHPIHKRTAP